MAIILYRHIPQRKICEPCETFFCEDAGTDLQKTLKKFLLFCFSKKVVREKHFP